MADELVKYFDFEDYSIPVVSYQGKPLFDATPICKILGYVDKAGHILRRIHESEKFKITKNDPERSLGNKFKSIHINDLDTGGVDLTPLLGTANEKWFVNVGGLFDLVLKARTENIGNKKTRERIERFNWKVRNEWLPNMVTYGYAIDHDSIHGDSEKIDRLFKETSGVIRKSVSLDIRFTRDKLKEVSYNYDDGIARRFYSEMHNIIHYAVTKMTAAEIAYRRANPDKPKMGMIALGDEERVTKTRAKVAMNYLTRAELTMENAIIMSFFNKINVFLMQGKMISMSKAMNVLIESIVFLELEEKPKNYKAEISVALKDKVVVEFAEIFRDREYNGNTQKAIIKNSPQKIEMKKPEPKNTIKILAQSSFSFA